VADKKGRIKDGFGDVVLGSDPSKGPMILNVLGKNLSVGSRALAKHAHRSSESFWGNASGPQEQQNSRGIEVLGRLLRRVAWWNWHVLPGGFVVFEVRTPEGYGARWGANQDPDGRGPGGYGDLFENIKFVGFVEPHSKEGFANKWRH